MMALVFLFLSHCSQIKNASQQTQEIFLLPIAASLSWQNSSNGLFAITVTKSIVDPVKSCV